MEQTETMSSLTTFETGKSSYSDPLFISQESMNVFLTVVNIFILGVISLVGVVSNVINLVIFTRQVLRDSMTVGLFALSFTDFSITTLELTISCIYLAKIICPWSPVDLWALAYVSFAWAAYAGYLISCWITAMISLERCLCVAFPFKVKQMFTRDRCAFVVFVIYLLIISTFLPVFIVEKMEWSPLDARCMNSSLCNDSPQWSYTVVFTEASVEVETALDITAGLFLSITSQLLLFICSVWMTVSLKISSSVRTKRLQYDEETDKGHGTNSNLTAQEKRLVKMVLFLSVVQSACNLPRLTVTIFYHAFPGINIEDHKNFSTVVWTSAVVINNVSCTCNSWGYYFLNSSYRRTFRKMFHMEDRKKQ